jgi:hypothetical protein
MVLAVVVIAALVVVIAVLATQLVRKRRSLGAADARVASLETQLAGVMNDVAALTAQLEATSSALGQVREELSDARVEIEGGAAALADAMQRLAATGKELGETRDELAEVRAAAHDGRALWALELARSERRWRHSVAPGIDTPSPFPTAADPLRLAVEVAADTLREEVGTRITVSWGLPQGLGPEQSLVVLRLAQEMAAGVAKAAETLDLDVRAEARDVIVAVRAVDEFGEEIDVPLPALPDRRIRREGNVVRVLAQA